MYYFSPMKNISLLILFAPLFLFSCTSHLSEITDYDSLFEKDMVLVEGGWFVMGCLDDNWINGSYCHSEDCPEHMVYVDSFYIGKYEVTFEQWEAVMGAYPKCFNERYLEINVPFYKKSPIFHVTWSDCQEFIAKLNKRSKRRYRMPTEAEWEYAAKGGIKTQNYIFSGSDSASDVAVIGNEPRLVGSLKPNELGLYDMSGNVKEWCSDWYDLYKADKQTNPKGANSGASRVVRGGSYASGSLYYAVKKRDSSDPDYKGDIGLRLVIEL